MKLNWYQRRIVKWAKAWEPRLTAADAMSSGGSGWPVSSGQDLEGNVKAVRYTTWAFICISKIVRSIAGLPMNFYQGYGDNPKKLTSHPVLDLLHRPNPEDTHRELWMDTAGFQLATGSAYWALDQVSEYNGRIVPGRTTIWTLPAHRVKIVPAIGDSEKRIAGYEVTGATGQKVRYEPEQIVQFKSFNLENQYYGMAPLTVAMKTMETDFYARENNRYFFKHGANVGNVLESDQPYDENAEKRIIESWKKQQGYKNLNNLLISWAGLKHRDTKKGPKDLDFLNLIKLNREEIIALFGVPPAVVGLFEYANYANALMQKKEFWLETIIPMLLSFETRLNEMAFPRWTDQEIWMEFDISKVPALQEDQKDKAIINTMLVRARIKTQNEARADYKLEPIEGGDEFPALPTFGAMSLKAKAFDNRTDKWYQKDISRRKQERTFLDAMKEYFAGQKGRILKRLAAYPDGYTIDESNIEILFDELNEQLMLEHKMKPLVEKAIEDAGQSGIDEVIPAKSLRKQGEDISTQFNMADPEVLKWIEAKITSSIVRIGDSTKKKIRALISESVEEGWTLQKFAEEIGNINRSIFSNARSLTIAQTEIGAAMNAGSMMGYEQSGVVSKKEWLSARDSLVRDSHLAAEAEGPIGLGQKFSNGLGQPGDPAGPAEEIVNCRCDVAPVVEE